MPKVLIIGAGSIGNHLAHACRIKKWEVDIVDIDSQALDRTRNEIYPSRYGSWDEDILLYSSIPQNRVWDTIIIGTPPDTHTAIALDILKEHTPKVLLIEKPLTTPGMKDQDALTTALKNSGTRCLIGFNHNITDNTKFVETLIAQEIVGYPTGLSVSWLEDWSGIFKAHPWLTGPKDTYLGFTARGGGACCEHSHAIALWIHFSKKLALGSIRRIVGDMDMVRDNNVSYDETTEIRLTTAQGVVGVVKQDVKSLPATKMARIDGENGFIEWYANYESNCDFVRWCSDDKIIQERKFPKTRPDDFKNEINLIQEIMQSNLGSSAIDYEIGLQVAEITNSVVKDNCKDAL